MIPPLVRNEGEDKEGPSRGTNLVRGRNNTPSCNEKEGRDEVCPCWVTLQKKERTTEEVS